MDVELAEAAPATREIMDRYVEQYRDHPQEAEYLDFVLGDFGRRLGTFRMLATRTTVPARLETEDGDVPY